LFVIMPDEAFSQTRHVLRSRIDFAPTSTVPVPGAHVGPPASEPAPPPPVPPPPDPAPPVPLPVVELVTVAVVVAAVVVAAVLVTVALVVAAVVLVDVVLAPPVPPVVTPVERELVSSPLHARRAAAMVKAKYPVVRIARPN
jgi:hypothetical protein